MVKPKENRHKRWTVIGAWVVAGVVTLFVIALNWSLLQCTFVSTIFGDTSCKQNLLSFSEDLRNLAWILGAVVAFPIFVWRGWVADQQAVAANKTADAAVEQATAANTQAKTDARREIQERFQNAARMLAEDGVDARLAGIYALARIAFEHASDYHMQIVQLLCALVRYATPPKSGPCHNYVEAAAVVIGKRTTSKQISLEKGWSLNFVKAYLVGAILVNLNFSNAWLHYANLSNAVLEDTDLSNATLHEVNLSNAQLHDTNLQKARLTDAKLVNVYMHKANLTDADLTNADLTGADLTDVDLTNANLTGVKGITESQLSKTKAKKGHLPKLPPGRKWKGKEYE